ncbi:MAG TPA: hypothetical protein VHD62_09280 [Opitutaceae bacterium]|nr:hypothetical protein [Opitutaceae bacterium]
MRLARFHFPAPHRALAAIRFALLVCCAPLLVRATTIVPPDFSTLVNDSDYIVRAVAKNITTDQRAESHGGKIVTRVEFDLLEVIAGTPPASVTLEFVGGRIGDRQLRIEGMPEFKVGDEDILFVSGNGRSFCPLYAMAHGRYPVQADAATGKKFVARADHLPLHATAEIATPLNESAATTAASSSTAAALTPADFAQQIRAAVRPDARLNRAK